MMDNIYEAKTSILISALTKELWGRSFSVLEHKKLDDTLINIRSNSNLHTSTLCIASMYERERA